MMQPVPRVGDIIYVDDTDVVHKTYIRGGLATVSEVAVENERVWVCVAEVPGSSWAWKSYLAPMQADLAKRYGGIRAGKYIMGPLDAQDAEPP
jgi:hypothetical protein